MHSRTNPSTADAMKRITTAMVYKCHLSFEEGDDPVVSLGSDRMVNLQVVIVEGYETS